MSLDDYLPTDKKGMFMDTSEMPKKMQEVFNVNQIVADFNLDNCVDINDVTAISHYLASIK